MATISSDHHTAGITIPAAYLEDMRTALIREICSDGDALRDDQQSLTDGSLGAREDRAAALRWLHGDAKLLEGLLDAEQDTELSAPQERLSEALQGLARLVADRLVLEAGWGPADMGAVLQSAEELRWAAREAIRIEPSFLAVA